MRHYLTSQGKINTEMMCFENLDGYGDIFMSVSIWESDMWSLYGVSTWESDMWSRYTINDQIIPEDRHKANIMTAAIG